MMNDEIPRLSDTESWIRSTTLGRRGVMIGGVAAAGYALAAQPISASAIHTGADGLDTGWVTVPTGGFNMRAYRARPAGKKNAPVILVVHEVFGLHEWVQDMCRRYAQAGYHAIAPDLFQRKGDASQVADIKTLVETIVAPTPDDQVMSDLDATVAFAGKNGGDTKRLGITGYCWGGRIVWLYAAHSRKVQAGVACYGGLAKGRNATAVLDIAPQLKAPVLGLYGELDKGIPQTDIAAMRAALAKAQKPSKIKVFPGAEHGFFADYRPSYNESAAREGWADGLQWFKQWLV
jgi:carboxymethylenebutenolidase